MVFPALAPNPIRAILSSVVDEHCFKIKNKF